MTRSSIRQRSQTDDVVRAASLSELAERSDVFVVAIPPTPSTLGIVDGEVIDRLATGAICSCS